MASQFALGSIPVVETPTYKSNNTAFVASMLAADLASYVGCEVDPATKRVYFIISDLGNQCSEWERQFAKNVFPRVHPRVLLEARSYLQSEVLRVKPVGGRDDQTF